MKKHYSSKTAWDLIRDGVEKKYGTLFSHAFRVESSTINGIPDCFVQVRTPAWTKNAWVEIKTNGDRVRPLQAVFAMQNVRAGGRVVGTHFGLTCLRLVVLEENQATGLAMAELVLPYPLDAEEVAATIIEHMPSAEPIEADTAEDLGVTPNE